MATNLANARPADLLVDPRESLEVEIKNWLDLREDNEAKATFAKAALALANHGGGYVLLGLTELEGTYVEAVGRPAALDAYTQDHINGIIQNYADPPFHCAVHLIEGPTGGIFPVVAIPGGHRVPVRARRAGPNGVTVQLHAIYVRKPGPRSEPPQSASDWDTLLGRCLAARRDELFDQIRDLITGAVTPAAPADRPERLQEWIDRCLERWRQLTATLPADDSRRCPHGFHWFAYQLGGAVRAVRGAEFAELLHRSVVRHSGWPPFWYPTRAGIEPYPFDDLVECWLGRDEQDPFRDAAHSDFWRISPDGFAFLLRGYQEDGGEGRMDRPPAPGTVFDITLPTWRVGEVMLHAESLAASLIEGEATVNFRMRYEGLADRSLTSLSGKRMLMDGHVSRQDAITLETNVAAGSISPNLPEIVRPLLEPLYSLFDFFRLPAALVVEELAEMRKNRF
jgi:transcriptional regulator with XRE-family HTH domain